MNKVAMMGSAGTHIGNSFQIDLRLQKQPSLTPLIMILILLMAMIGSAHAAGKIDAKVAWNVSSYTGYLATPEEACSSVGTGYYVVGDFPAIPCNGCAYNLWCYFPDGTYPKPSVLASIFSSVTCPPNATERVGLGCICNDTFQPDTSGKSCVPDKLSITLEIGPEVEPQKGLSFKAVVKGIDGLKGGVPVTIILDVADKKSGGHEHGETNAAVRPRGSLSGATACPSTAPPRSVCATGVTSDKAPNIGEAWFTFGAPAPAGTHTLSATCSGCTNTVTAPIDVKVNGLAPIPDSSFYTMIESNGAGGTKVIGATNNHSDNHYLSPAAASILWSIAASYQMEAKFWQIKKRKKGQSSIDIPPPLLHLNDASLVWGGVFDISGKWKPAHEEHRRGTVIDVRANADPNGKPNSGAVPPGDFAEFEKTGLSFGGADAQIHCNRSDGQKRKKPLCIGADGSQDSNRHYHIRLLGVEE